MGAAFSAQHRRIKKFPFPPPPPVSCPHHPFLPFPSQDQVKEGGERPALPFWHIYRSPRPMFLFLLYLLLLLPLSAFFLGKSGGRPPGEVQGEHSGLGFDKTCVCDTYKKEKRKSSLRLTRNATNNLKNAALPPNPFPPCPLSLSHPKGPTESVLMHGSEGHLFPRPVSKTEMSIYIPRFPTYMNAVFCETDIESVSHKFTLRGLIRLKVGFLELFA